MFAIIIILILILINRTSVQSLLWFLTVPNDRCYCGHCRYAFFKTLSRFRYNGFFYDKKFTGKIYAKYAHVFEYYTYFK